jgi:putative ABC transport system substrate-binding protein
MLNRRRFMAFGCIGMVAGCSPRQPTAHRIGYLMLRTSPAAMDDAFVAGLRQLGYDVGRTVVLEYRWAGNDFAKLDALAAELVAGEVEVIVTATTAGTRAAMRATRAIPIVMAAAADPVGAGLVASLGQPGGNVTGISLQTTDIASKRIELVRELVPGARRLGLLAESVAQASQGTTATLVAETRQAAARAGVEVDVREVGDAEGLEGAFRGFAAGRTEALIVQVSPLLIEHRARIVDLAARARLPALYEARNFVDAGGLASYGPDLVWAYQRAAHYVDRILKGARPQELPVEQPERLSLTLNLGAAYAIGLAVPAALQARADEVLR